MSRLAELSEVLEGKLGEIRDFTSNGITIDGASVEVKTEDATKAQQLLEECKQIRGLIEVEQFGLDTSTWLAGEAGERRSAAMEHAALSKIVTDARGKTLGELFTESAEFTQYATSGRDSMAQPFELQLYDLSRGGIQRKDVYTALDSHPVNMGIGTRVQFDPLVPRGQRPNRVRDLFPAAATDANLIDYFKVIGFVEGGADHEGGAKPVPERQGGQFGMKPRSNLRFIPDQAPVRTIAHWEPIHRNVIQDVPQLQATINNELLYGLAIVEDDQLLNGDGTVENIKGLMRHNGIQVYTAPPNELKSDALRRATTLGVLANYPPTGFVLHPNDWEEIETQRGSGDGQYMLFTNIAIGAAAQVWRQPVVETPAIDQGTFLNGAFGTGAQVYDRQQASVRISEHHADYFIRNALVTLVEERLTLAVKRPEAFVRGTFD